MPDLHKRQILKSAAGLCAGAGIALGAVSAPAATARRSGVAFVLVHGGWHGAWCFERVAPALAAQGHRVIARDLPGHGLEARFPAAYLARSGDASLAGEPSPIAAITLDDYVTRILESIDGLRATGHDKVVVLGHSMGGVVLNAVGERAPEKIDALVYLAASMPASGVPGGAYFGYPEGADARVNPVLLGDPFKTGAFRIDPRREDAVYREALREAFYNDATETDFEAAANLLTPDMPVKPAVTPITLTPARWGSIERHYVLCTQDQAVPVALARRFVAEADAFVPARPTRVHTLQSGHSSFVTAPRALLGVLSEVAAGLATGSAATSATRRQPA